MRKHMEKHTSHASYAASACTALVGGITLQDLALWVGIATALGTFIVNWYYKAKETREFIKGVRDGSKSSH